MERGILYTLAVVLALALLILIISFGAVFALISFRNRRPGYFGSGMGSNCSHAAAIGEIVGERANDRYQASSMVRWQSLGDWFRAWRK